MEMSKEKIARINELKRLSDRRELTPQEQEERAALRAEYISGFRANMQAVLDNVRIQDADGTVRPLQKKKPQ